NDKFDLIFIDAPYNKGMSEIALANVDNCINPNGIVVCETEKTEQLPDKVGILTKIKEYKYGKAKITTYRNVCHA
ncbi:MAG: RsmD family RNA methyltransferase, partial [Oscillospiraceae bacterium]